MERQRETQVMSEWIYLVQRCLEPLTSMNTGDPLSVRFELWFQDHCAVSGTVNWQDGISLNHSELLDPAQWSNMAACGLEAITEARRMIGEHWAHGGQGEPS